ncbi:MAG TPA: hypothetical protein VK700_11130 [Steroidobacteraceae bacterium]|jgi:hypothetical protein|nr:hypothetical protein [Steroidobacteraceae bacterium]
MRALLVVVVALACAAPAFGQAPEDLQPGVNTSDVAPPRAAPSSAPAAASSTSAAAPAPAARAAAPAGKTAKGGKAIDRLDLDTTQITGNKELPKVMYVVPWKHSDLGDLTGKPANSLVDEILQPVDRDVFNREERYYHTVAPQKSPSDPPAGPAADH